MLCVYIIVRLMGLVSVCGKLLVVGVLVMTCSLTLSGFWFGLQLYVLNCCGWAIGCWWFWHSGLGGLVVLVCCFRVIY